MKDDVTHWEVNHALIVHQNSGSERNHINGLILTANSATADTRWPGIRSSIHSGLDYYNMLTEPLYTEE